MNIIDLTLGEFVEILEKHKTVEEELRGSVILESLNDVVGNGNYLILKDKVLCVLKEGVVVIPYHLSSDNDFYSFRLFHPRNIQLVQGEELVCVRQQLAELENKQKFIVRHLQ